jgi:CheY-like chemotaxis protein
VPSPRILLVEDNRDEVELLRRAFRKLGSESELAVAEDGEEAAALLSGGGPLPELVILDLKMPRRSGLELLGWMRSKPELARVAVVIFSASEEREDIERAKALGVVSYLVKPGGFGATCDAAKAILGIWAALREGQPYTPIFPSSV